MVGSWLLRMMDQRPTIFTSFAIGGVGFCLPFVVIPVREALGYQPRFVSVALYFYHRSTALALVWPGAQCASYKQ